MSGYCGTVGVRGQRFSWMGVETAGMLWGRDIIFLPGNADTKVCLPVRAGGVEFLTESDERWRK